MSFSRILQSFLFASDRQNLILLEKAVGLIETWLLFDESCINIRRNLNVYNTQISKDNYLTEVVY